MVLSLISAYTMVHRFVVCPFSSSSSLPDLLNRIPHQVTKRALWLVRIPFPRNLSARAEIEPAPFLVILQTPLILARQQETSFGRGRKKMIRPSLLRRTTLLPLPWLKLLPPLLQQQPNHLPSRVSPLAMRQELREMTNVAVLPDLVLSSCHLTLFICYFHLKLLASTDFDVHQAPFLILFSSSSSSCYWWRCSTRSYSRITKARFYRRRN